MMSNLDASSPAMTGDIENLSTEEDVKRKMYRAVLRDEWAEAKVLIEQNRKITLGPISELGDRALHLSIAMKHKRFAKKLIKLMEPHELDEVDENGYTACCYAAMSNKMTAIARLLIERNHQVLKKRNNEGKTPLQMASLNGKSEMISLLVSSIREKGLYHETLTDEEWFDILHTAIRTKMYEIASQILACNKALAIQSKKGEGTDSMGKKEKGTALHMLARQDINETVNNNKTAILFKSIIGTTFYGRQIYGEMDPDSRDLAVKLLEKMKESCLEDEKQVVEILQNPPILYDAAKVGNVELIVMLTREFPDLLCKKDTHNRSIFHYAVIYRQEAVFELIRQIEGLKNLVVLGNDADGNNILHLAAKQAHLRARNGVVSIPALQMQRELAWFKEVEDIVPMTFANEKNHEGLKPRKLFSREHKDLLKESKDWMKSTADSCMLIATIILTVVYAAAFTVPGGNNSDTGLPILERSTWFTCFFVFEALALFGSTLCVIVFWSITSSGFREELFLYILPYQLKLGLSGLFVSLIGAISAFMSAYCLVLVDEREWHMKSIILLIYVMLVLAVCGRFSELWFTIKLPKSLNWMLSNGHSSTTLFSKESLL